MQNNKNLIYIIAAVVVVCIIFFNGCSTYNTLVDESASLDQSWAEVQNQYQRRFDLIPNLVSTVKGYAEHEKTTFENVTAARAGLENAYNSAKQLEVENPDQEESLNKYVDAQGKLNKAVGLYINAVHEAYPELKADQNFRALQSQLEGTENRVTYARNQYTNAVKSYNVKVRRFPASIWASLFGFSVKPQFKADTEAQEAVRVSFD